MIYDLSDNFQAEQFKCRCSWLFNNKRVVSLTEKKQQRTTRQNAYLHSILGVYALELGYTLEEAKQWHFKEACNPDLFVAEKVDRVTGTVRKVLRSTRELTTEQMQVAIERFRNWAASNAGIYLPSAEDARAIMQMEREVAAASKWL